MKQFVIATLILAISGMANAQKNPVKDFFYQYEDEEDVTTVTLHGGLIKFATWIAEMSEEEDEDIKSFKRLSEGVKRMRILDMDRYERIIGEDGVNDLRKDMEDYGYEIFMTSRSNGQDVKIYSRMMEDEAKLKDIVILVTERNELSIINIEGTIDLDDVQILINHKD